jgi:L-asparaginase
LRYFIIIEVKSTTISPEEKVKMQKTVIISTGGTFNKVYEPITGSLTIDKTSRAVSEIASKWQCDFTLLSIIGKDSLEMTSQDRLELLSVISHTEEENIIVIHGTDTMHTTAAYLADAEMEKRIILTGAMVPYSIDPVEATANLTSAIGYMQKLSKSGVYIAMHGLFSPHEEIIKERSQGRFVRKH